MPHSGSGKFRKTSGQRSSICHDGYENVTFPALKDGTTFKRQDETHIVDVRLTFKLLYDEKLFNDEQVKSRLEAVLDYQSNINDSNIPTDEYDQPRFLASLKVNF